MVLTRERPIERLKVTRPQVRRLFSRPAPKPLAELNPVALPRPQQTRHSVTPVTEPLPTALLRLGRRPPQKPALLRAHEPFYPVSGACAVEPQLMAQMAKPTQKLKGTRPLL